MWDHLFKGSDAWQTDQIEENRRAIQVETDVVEGELLQAKRQIARLELILEAVVRILEEHGLLDLELLARMVQQIDLEDGVEDGGIGPDRTANAPKCPHCGRPVNPRRTECIYCGGPLTPTAGDATQDKNSPARMTTCRHCGKVISERDGFVSEYGILCATCFYSLQAEDQ